MTRCGSLIYTATAGSLGTLGGLVATTQRLPLFSRRRCDGCRPAPASRTDDGALHGAACHGCLLIGETTCEMRYVFLDRALIVDTRGVAGREPTLNRPLLVIPIRIA